MKAKIYRDPEDKQGIVLTGKVVSFFLGTEGWNLVMRGSRVAEEHPDLFETVLDLNKDKMLKGNWGKEPKSKAEINGDTTWLGFRIDSGVKVQIYKEDKEE